MLSELIEKHFKCGAYVSKIRTKAYCSLYDWIIMQTPLLQQYKCNIPTMCYWIIHDLHDFPKCKNCGKDIISNVINFKDGY